MEKRDGREEKRIREAGQGGKGPGGRERPETPEDKKIFRFLWAGVCSIAPGRWKPLCFPKSFDCTSIHALRFVPAH